MAYNTNTDLISQFPVGTKVRLTYVPGAVKNLAIGLTGVVESPLRFVADIPQLDLRLADGRQITLNADYVEALPQANQASTEVTSPVNPRPQTDSLPIETVKIPIQSIRRDGGTQPRATINQAVVEEYAQEMKDGAVFPPVILFNDGKYFTIADGYHRLLASESIGLSEIAAEVRQGTRRDAILFSCSANATHGLRRSAADKRRSVLRLLEDEQWGQWSDREIARRCLVTHKTVSHLRKSIWGNSPDTKLNKERKVQRGGKIYTVNTANIGKTERPTEKQPEPTAAGENSPDSVEQESDERDQQLELKDQRTVTYSPLQKVESQNQDILLAFAKNLGALSHEQLKFVGKVIARQSQERVETVVSEIGICSEAQAVAIVKAVLLVYPEAIEQLLAEGSQDLDF